MNTGHVQNAEPGWQLTAANPSSCKANQNLKEQPSNPSNCKSSSCQSLKSWRTLRASISKPAKSQTKPANNQTWKEHIQHHPRPSLLKQKTYKVTSDGNSEASKGFTDIPRALFATACCSLHGCLCFLPPAPHPPPAKMKSLCNSYNFVIICQNFRISRMD